MLKKILKAGCVFAISFLLVECSGEQQESAAADGLIGQLIVTGSSTIAPLAGEIAKRFEQEHPGTRIDVQSGGSSRGIADVRRGMADIGMVSRQLNPDENDLVGYPIARDGVAVILHRDNPLQAVAVGAAIGVIGAASAAAYYGQPPEEGLCWYYTNPSRSSGFWDVCPY